MHFSKKKLLKIRRDYGDARVMRAFPEQKNTRHKSKKQCFFKGFQF